MLKDIIYFLEDFILDNYEIFPKLCYTLTTVLGETKSYEELKYYAQLGIDYCFAHNSYIQLGNLNFMLAIAQKMLGNTADAKKTFDLSYSFYTIQNRKKGIP